jgi:uncharacterized protein DUF4440
MKPPSSGFTTLFPGMQGRTPQERSPLAPPEAAAAVRALNQEYIIALRTNDTGWFRQHLAEEVVVIQGDGRRMGKAEFLTSLKDAPQPFRSLIVRHVSVRTFGPAVQVDADAPWELADGLTGVSRYIDTYAWLDGRWQVISAQITPLP